MHKAFIFGGQKKKLIKVKLWITFCPETEKKIIFYSTQTNSLLWR